MNKDLPLPVNEKERIEALNSYNILDTEPEDVYDNITRLAAGICEVPIALISLIDTERQWIKSRTGLDAEETPRCISICQYTIMGSELFEVSDTLEDPRFSNNPLVTDEPGIRFYAGHPINDLEGHNLGTLCVIDKQPNKLTAAQSKKLKELADIVTHLIRSRITSREHVIYKQFFDFSLDMLCIAGTDTYFKVLNPAFTNMLGWTEEELKSKPFLDFVHPDDIGSTLKEVEKLSKGVPTIDFKNRYRKKDGNYLWMHWNSMPDKKTGELYAVAHDITQMVEANERLEKAIHHKEIFLSNMSHEIRTPMNAIKGFAELLQSTPLNEEQKDYLDTISMASDNLLVVINDILDVSKIQSGKITLEEKPFSITAVVQQVARLTRKKASRKGLKLITSIDHEIPKSVVGDPVRLTQILVNLIGNAIKFTHEGRVEVQVLVNDFKNNAVGISFNIKDSGIGIPEDKIDHVFERFEQASKNTTREFGGTGLGLSIVRMLVEMQNGTINVKSKVGEGSEFIISIDYPISDTHSAMSEMLDNVVADSDSLSNVRILLAEDNEMNQKLVEKYLMKHGGDLTIVSNGSLAVDEVRDNKYDVIIMDLQMPKMDGYQATREIRNGLNSNIPIVACTAHSLIGEKQRCLDEGMDGYVSKPYTERELINALFQVLPESHLKSKARLSGIRADIHLKIKELEAREGSDFTASLMEIYNKRIPDDLETLKTACENQDYDSIKEKAHLISSSLTTLNFSRGFEISKKLEACVIEGQMNEAKELCFELVEFLQKSLKVTKLYSDL